MMLHQLHFCFLAILLSLGPKSGRAITDEEKEIDAPVDWQRTIYNNDNTEKATMKVRYVSGIRNRQSGTDTLVATHNTGIIGKGDFFSIASLEVSYSFMYQSSSDVMSESEIYYTNTIETIVTIPPRSTLTRWELVADIAGTVIGYQYYIDVINNTEVTPQTYVSRAKVRIRRRINYGHTRIRIKHLDRGEYMTVIDRKHWPAATLGHSTRYLYVLCEDELGFRLKTLNTMYPGYVWAFSSSAGGIYFDWNRQIGHAYDRNVDIQHWWISKEKPHYNGDVVTFTNMHYKDSAMCYYEGPETNVYCLSGREDMWVLETADERESSINHCQ